MPKPLEIKRIDLLVHPFYGLIERRKRYTEKDAYFLLGAWKKHIDAIAKDRSRMLLVNSEEKRGDTPEEGD